jgi:hypothetical protein
MEKDPSPAKFKVAEYFTSAGAVTPDGTAHQPHLLGEVHFDTYHVRSQTKLTGVIRVALPFIELGPDDLWLPEMIQHADPASLTTSPPVGFARPDAPVRRLADQYAVYKDKLVQTILRFHRIRLLHHPTLGVYSEYGESRGEFEARCLYLLTREVQEELRELQHRFERMMDGIIQKSGLNYIKTMNEDPTTDRVMAGQKQMIFSTRDALTRIFQDIRDLPDHPPADRAPSNDVEDALASLYQQAWLEAKAVADRLKQQIGLIEEYSFHIQYNDIAMVQLALLWGPA